MLKNSGPGRALPHERGLWGSFQPLRNLEQLGDAIPVPAGSGCLQRLLNDRPRQFRACPEIFEERLGYGKANGRWGLTLCTVTKNEKGEKEIKDSWLFNDAPRNLRLKAIEHVPALIEALAREAAQTAKKVSDGADFARQLAVSISAVAHAKGNRR